jgi:hypothetical protein
VKSDGALLDLICDTCGTLTTPLEANSRRFNQGFCHCGGRLLASLPRDLYLVEVAPQDH